MVRYSSSPATTGYSFWVDAPAGRPLRVELFVKHLGLTPEIQAVAEAMPDWTSTAVVTTWQSVWEFP